MSTLSNPAKTILLGTSSRHKAEEIGHIFASVGLAGMKLLTLRDLAEVPPEPVEDGDSFLANATIKARAYAQAAGQWTLTDDSGLCVDALDGLPGVHSAYYAGLPRDDERNNRKLLEALRAVPDEKRNAHFVCQMVLVRPDGHIVATSRGEVQGVIIHQPLGSNGFGYDPLFALVADEMVDPDWVGKTTAQLPTEQKNRISHRGRAARAMGQLLKNLVAWE